MCLLSQYFLFCFIPLFLCSLAEERRVAVAACIVFKKAAFDASPWVPFNTNLSACLLCIQCQIGVAAVLPWTNGNFFPLSSVALQQPQWIYSEMCHYSSQTLPRVRELDPVQMLDPSSELCSSSWEHLFSLCPQTSPSHLLLAFLHCSLYPKPLCWLR